ncbi:MAG TPA: hypothetical protein VFD71_13420 [Planctomycetota bacterium]|nr:hypothetical protein [Planctomycetota bacterium]
MNRNRRLSWCFVLTLGSAALLRPAFADDIAGVLKNLSDGNETVRRSAWEKAGELGSDAVLPLVELASGENRDASLAGQRALTVLAHASAAPGREDRKRVAAALAAALADAKAAPGVRVLILDLLGSVGDGDVVPGLEKLLADPQLGDPARRALERIPGDASARALESAIDMVPDASKDAVILSLGKKRARTAVPKLTQIALAEGAHRVAAAKALARVGDPAGAPAIRAVIEAAAPRDRTELLADYLRFAADLQASGERAAAEAIYDDVLRNADETRRYAALYAIYGVPDATRQDPARLLAALEDASPRVRTLALELLTLQTADNLDALVAERFRAARGARRAALLRVLVARKAAGVEDRLREALADGDLDVKVTAFELSGKLDDADSEPFLFEALEKSSVQVKTIAARACIDRAEKRSTADPAGAVRLYRKAYEASDDVRDRSRALLGLARLDGPGALSLVDAARRDPLLAANAQLAYVICARAIGARGKKEQAITILREVVASRASRDTVREALAALRELGEDATSLQKQQGVLAAWRVVGPFPNPEGKGFDAVYSPEKELKFDGTQLDERGRKRKWEDVISTSPDGKVDLREVFQRSNDVCAYAYAEIDCARSTEVRLKIGSDDGAAVWLNGKKVISTNSIRAWAADQDSVDAVLEKGKNAILVKITQGGGEWDFSLRVTDRQDRALDLNALAKQ